MGNNKPVIIFNRGNALVRFGQNRFRTLVSMAEDSFHRVVMGKSCDYCSASIFMPLTLKKWGHIGFGLSVCVYACMHWTSRYRLETSCMDSS